MSKLITVFGATGNQGGSVIKHIRESPQLSEWRIRGITRDVTKPAAQTLANQGVEVVTADMTSTSSLKAALEGSHTVFLVTNYWQCANEEVEFTQGKNVTDVCKAVGVSRIIFSSLVPVKEMTNGRLSHVPHFDEKAKIEKYIRQSGLSCTFILAGYFMPNFLQMLGKSEEDGIYRLFYPVDGQKAKFPLFDPVADTGLFVKAALIHGDKLEGKRVLAASGYYTAEEIINTFSNVTGKEAVFVQVTPDQFKASLPDAVAQEFLENHLFIEDPGYFLGEPLDESLKLLDSKPTEWKEYVKRNASAWP